MSTDTIALISLVIAAGGVLYQALAYKVSKRELNLKIHDLSQLVQRLEDEASQRRSLAKKHDTLHVETLTRHADALNYTTELDDIHEGGRRQRDRNIDSMIADIQYMLMALNVVLREMATGLTAESEAILAAIPCMCSARLDHLALSSAWDMEREAAIPAKVDPTAPDAVRLSEARLKTITTEIARLEGKYTEDMRALGVAMQEARARFVGTLQQDARFKVQ